MQNIRHVAAPGLEPRGREEGALARPGSAHAAAARPALPALPTLRHVEGGAQREVDGEPAEHVWRVGGRVDGQVHVPVQLGVKVARKAVADCGRARAARWTRCLLSGWLRGSRRMHVARSARQAPTLLPHAGSSGPPAARPSLPVPPGGVQSNCSRMLRVLSMRSVRLGCSKVKTSCGGPERASLGARRLSRRRRDRQSTAPRHGDGLQARTAALANGRVAGRGARLQLRRRRANLRGRQRVEPEQLHHVGRLKVVHIVVRLRRWAQGRRRGGRKGKEEHKHSRQQGGA